MRVTRERREEGREIRGESEIERQENWKEVLESVGRWRELCWRR